MERTAYYKDKNSFYKVRQPNFDKRYFVIIEAVKCLEDGIQYEADLEYIEETSNTKMVEISEREYETVKETAIRYINAMRNFVSPFTYKRKKLYER